MVRLIELFKIFSQIGAFTLGGGYAMLSMVERAIVTQKRYIQKDEFWDLIALVQTLPGVFAINTALYVGYKLRKTKGAIVAAIGAALPSFITILLIAIFFTEYKDNEIVERIFKGIRPCVVALILVPCIRLIKAQYTGWENTGWKILLIPIVVATAIWWFKVSPITIIFIIIIGTLLFEMYSFNKIKKGK